MAPPSKARTPLRFLAVGLANTAVDVGLLLWLTASGMPLWSANMVSTTAALGLSFALNRSFTFRSSGNPIRQGILFLGVTLVGLWVLQPILLWATVPVLQQWLAPSLALLIAKGGATVVTMIWNFFLYRSLVFPDSKKVSHHE